MLQICTLENGRAAANMLSGLKTSLEFGQVPAIQIRPVICALLGMLHIRCEPNLTRRALHADTLLYWKACFFCFQCAWYERILDACRFSLLWAPAAEALGMALKQHPDIAWPLMFSALARTQTELLAGRGAGQAPGMSSSTSDAYTHRACRCDLSNLQQLPWVRAAANSSHTTRFQPGVLLASFKDMMLKTALYMKDLRPPDTEGSGV